MSTITDSVLKVPDILDRTVRVVRAKLEAYHKDKVGLEITLDSHLVDGLGLDSIDVLELHSELEREFNFDGDEQVWELFNTVLGLVVYVAAEAVPPHIEHDNKADVFVARSLMLHGLITQGQTKEEANNAFETATKSLLKAHAERNSLKHLLKEHL